MDPQAVGSATDSRSERVTSAPPSPRKPAPWTRWGLWMAGSIGAALVVSLVFVVVSSSLGLFDGNSDLGCGGTVSSDSLISIGHGATNELCIAKSFSTMPADDAAFEAWLRAQPGVQEVGTRRVGGHELRLRLEYLHGAGETPQWLLSPPWEELGYQPASGVSPSLFGAPLPRLNG